MRGANLGISVLFFSANISFFRKFSRILYPDFNFFRFKFEVRILPKLSLKKNSYLCIVKNI
jgi:hypothetical protein